MNLLFDAATFENGKLCLSALNKQMARRFVMEMKRRTYQAEIKEHRKKRSLDANALYWKLCGSLSAIMGVSPESTYKRHIKDIGNYEVLCLKAEAVDGFNRMWTSGHLGRFTETRASKLNGCVTVLAYYGSSDFNKKQMSALIDNCMQDCEAVGIETISEERLKIIKDDWNE